MQNVISLQAERERRAAAADPLSVICAEMRKPASEWHRGWMAIALAKAEYLAADYRRVCASLDYGKDDQRTAAARAEADTLLGELQRAQLRQLFIDAPHVRGLRWKEQTAARFRFTDATRAQVEAVLTRDRAEHSRQIATDARRAATRRARKSQ